MIIITCALSAIQYCIAQNLSGKAIHKSLTREKVDELIVVVDFKGEALREECWYGTAQFKFDTRVQQTRVHLTDFVEAHASCSHAGCMAREHMHDRIHCPRASIHA